MNNSDHITEKEHFKENIQKLYNERITKRVSEWAVENRILTEDLTKYPGPWSHDIAPYLIEIMDCMSEGSDIREIAIMKGHQLCFTTGILENSIGYWIDHVPGPILYLTGDEQLAGESMELKIDKMLATSGLQDKIFSQTQKKHSKKTGDTKKIKEFPGGHLVASGPRSSGRLRGFARRYLVRDEIDAAPPELRGEGSFIGVSDKRTSTYGEDKKILDISTPTERKTSHIYKRFLRGDQRYYFVPCKHCKHKQRLVWKNIKYKQDENGKLIEDSVHYECEKCGKKWKNLDKVYFLSLESGAAWQPTTIPLRNYIRSYHMSSLYSPVGFLSWEEIVQQWIEIETKQQRQEFINLILGEAWEDYGEAPEWNKIFARSENYSAGEIPSECLLLTLGADVQKDRLECEIVAWGKHSESWSVNYFVLMADDEINGTQDTRDSCWQTLKEIIIMQRQFPDGSMRSIDLSFIDSSYRTSTVYEFCSLLNGVYPVQGDESPVRKQAFKKIDLPEYDVVRYDINTSIMKDEIYKNLRHDKPLPGEDFPRGYCHFPKEYGERYYKGLTAEDRVIKELPSGAVKITWENIRQRKNEPLDCRVYALAALYVINSIIAADYKDKNGKPYLKSIPWSEFWRGVSERRQAA